MNPADRDPILSARSSQADFGVDPDTGSDVQEVTSLDMLTWLGEGKRLIATAAAAAAMIALSVALLLPSKYTARATFLPPANSQGSAVPTAAAAALGALGGAAAGFAPKTADELYLALFRTDSVTRALDERFQLRERLEVETFEDLRTEILKVVRVALDRRSGVISIDVDDKEPMFAAQVANALGDEVAKVLSRLAVTEAQQRRAFFEQQVQVTQEALIRAEDDLRAFQERSGVIAIDKQAEALLLGSAQVRSLIAEREVQLRVLRATATPENPDVLRLRTEIDALRSELRGLEARRTEAGSTGTSDLRIDRLPSAGIDFLRARRNVKLQETLLEGMVRQLEAAKLDEAREGPALQLVEAAVAPDRRSGPKRSMIVIGTVMAAVAAACLFILLRGWLRASRATNPKVDSSLARVRQAWRW
jgi:tyrosine-protein kinase Etk/Wzc